MKILEKIILNKRKEVKLLKEQNTVTSFENSNLFSRATFSLSGVLLEQKKSGVITEFKRKSPSGGLLNPHAGVAEVTNGYSHEGASGISILTDILYFGGSCSDIVHVRADIDIPILRKDFIIDEIQILESKASGADVILLIATVLDKKEIFNFATLSRSLGMEVLFEIHSMKDLEKVNEHVNIIGVNNRDLGTLKTNVRLSEQMANKVPAEFVRISESGISVPQTIIDLRNMGYNGFLIGEYFMSKPDPVQAFAEFVKKLK